MKIKVASLFGVSLALAVIAFAAPAQARDNNGYGNYLSSGVSSNFGGRGGSCDRDKDGDGGHHRHGQRAFGGQFQNQYGNQNQFGNQNQLGIYPNTPFGANTAYGYNQNVGYNGFGGNQSLLNQVTQIQQQLSAGNLSSRDRNKLVNRLNKLQARLGNQNYGSNVYNNGILSNLRNQYLNNGTLNNGLGVNGLANAGYVNQVRGMLGF
jgi:hypothetical protein